MSNKYQLVKGARADVTSSLSTSACQDSNVRHCKVESTYSYWMLPGAKGDSLSYCRKWMGPAELSFSHACHTDRNLPPGTQALASVTSCVVWPVSS